MLSQLTIKNYALIDDLRVSFSPGFTTITGETGAGKSILLGGLSLVLGKRADMTSLRDKERKCVIEAVFAIGSYGLEAFFKDHDLEYDPQTIIRREVHPGGKSRAFVNDTPVTLDVLSGLGERLIDVHSQNETLQLTENEFQLKVIDALASNSSLLGKYQKQLQTYRKTTDELDQLIELQRNAIKEHDYNTYLWKELEAVTLKNGLEEELEQQHEQLSNVEQILELLGRSHQLLYDEQVGILTLLAEMKQSFNKLARFGGNFTALNERIHSVLIELDDMAGELKSMADTAETDPSLLEQVAGRLQVIHDLKKKHGAADVTELIGIRADLAKKISITENLSAEIDTKRGVLLQEEEELGQVADELGKQRKEVLPGLKDRLESDLAGLGMPNATFRIEIHEAPGFKMNGRDELVFLFSANRGTAFGELKKVASGGELSRIMLAIKSILSRYEQLPTMMFDEIDSGVSGEISNKMGDIMQEMSRHMQIFAITHLPQVASKGSHHFKVYKEDDQKRTHTKMKLLDADERVVELAAMLGGKSFSDSAMAHARDLLN